MHWCFLIPRNMSCAVFTSICVQAGQRRVPRPADGLELELFLFPLQDERRLDAGRMLAEHLRCLLTGLCRQCTSMAHGQSLRALPANRRRLRHIAVDTKATAPRCRSHRTRRPRPPRPSRSVAGAPRPIATSAALSPLQNAHAAHRPVRATSPYECWVVTTDHHSSTAN